MARLWKVFDGEPFMVNPHLGILGLNPRRKMKVARLKKGSKEAKAYMAKIRRRRKNPFPVGGLVLNPRRRRRGGGRKRSAGSRRHVQKIVLQNRRHRRRRHNPSLGRAGASLAPVLYAGGGFVGTVALESVLTSGETPIIPVSITGNTLGKYAVRIGCGIAVAYLGKIIMGMDKAKQIAIGGGVYILTSAIKDFMPGTIPGMAAYRPMGAYRQLAAPRMNAGVLPFGVRSAPQLSGPGTPSRFRRFN